MTPTRFRVTATPTRVAGRGRARTRLESVLLGLEALVSVSGLAGGAYLMARPTTAMPMSLLEGTGFTSWRLPGAALFALVGVAPGLVLATALARLRVARIGHLLVGAGLVAWIAVEMIWVVVTLPLQLTYAAIGVVITVLGLALIRQGAPHG